MFEFDDHEPAAERGAALAVRGDGRKEGPWFLHGAGRRNRASRVWSGVNTERY